MLLSVIIPYYHVEAYLDDCLARVARIPANLCEVLLVDDCGQDGSWRIAADYAERYPHMRIIRREANGGLSAARNSGLAQAKGEYVYFLDSDDLPEPEALVRMVEYAQAQRLDVVKGRFLFFDDETLARTPGPMIAQQGVERGSALLTRQCRDEQYEPMVWQCAYRRAFLEEQRLVMAEGLLFEDELFQAPALLAAERAAVVEETILLYRQRAGSIMKSFSRNAKWCVSYLEVCRRLDALARQGGDPEAVRAIRKRTAQIALSIAKNIPAYGLPAPVAKEAMRVVRENRGVIAGYALRSGDAVIAAQGLLLAVSPSCFIKLYSMV